MTDPLSLFAPELVQAIERLVDERVKAALAELEPSNGSPWLSVADAAVYLGVSERTVGRLLERGRIRSTYDRSSPAAAPRRPRLAPPRRRRLDGNQISIRAPSVEPGRRSLWAERRAHLSDSRREQAEASRASCGAGREQAPGGLRTPRRDGGTDGSTPGSSLTPRPGSPNKGRRGVSRYAQTTQKQQAERFSSVSFRSGMRRPIATCTANSAASRSRSALLSPGGR